MENELVITRNFNAPRDVVWKAFTEVEHLMQWWGPKGATMLAAKLELKPGGLFHYGMRMPDGRELWGKFTYREIRPQDFLSYTSGFSDASGGNSGNPWLPIWPQEVLNTVTFKEKDGKTIFTLKGGPINCTEEERQAFVGLIPNMQGGFKGTFDQLDAYLAEQK
jgi:uncharacterized protein YndB with AHSA1/START domain